MLAGKIAKGLKWVGIALLTLIVLPLIFGGATRLLTRDVPPPGTLYDVGGFRLHIDCKGQLQGAPAVIVEGGAMSASPTYYWLQHLLQSETMVCTYDRAGLGWSDNSVTPRDSDTITRELHALLVQAGIEPPLVLVGHSIGGAHIRVYADNYPNDVAGLVFVDSTHPDQFVKSGITNDMIEASYGTYQFLEFAGTIGLLPYIYNTAPSDAGEQGLPSEALNQLNWFNRNGRLGREGLKEIKKLSAVLDRTRETAHFGDIPILVFTAGKNDNPNTEELEEQGAKLNIISDLQAELALLSSNGRHRVIPEATHTSINTDRIHAEVVTEAIDQMLTELKGTQR